MKNRWAGIALLCTAVITATWLFSSHLSLATILHQEAHRPARIPQRYSRHYYDLYKLAVSPIRETAFAQISLLREVVDFKKRFYPSAWASYDLAFPGTFKLLPTAPSQITNLERDYQNMQVMLFGDPPDFRSILDGLRDLESQINSLPWREQ